MLENGVTRRSFARRSLTDLEIPDVLLARTDDLAAFVRAAAEASGLNAKRIVALSYSDGANAAVSPLLRHPGLPARAALLRPTPPYEADTPVALARTDVLITTAARNPYVEPGEAERLARLL